MNDHRAIVMNKVKEWADKLFPCEAHEVACDSFGVCDNCCEHSLVMAGASKACSIIYDKPAAQGDGGSVRTAVRDE